MVPELERMAALAEVELLETQLREAAETATGLAKLPTLNASDVPLASATLLREAKRLVHIAEAIRKAVGLKEL